MSSALAIASVTYVLKDLLNNGLIDHDLSALGNVMVTALPPDRIDTTDNNTTSQLNLYMYRVTTNQGWQNVDLPSRDVRGDRLANPPLALNLHYLLTAYGVKELHGEILLGYGMQLLHETPVLVRDAIRRSLVPIASADAGGDLPPELLILSTSELADQIEQIKMTSESLSTEETSKLWAAFQAKYRPSAAYQATVVLIESRKSTKSALPVNARKIYPMPFRQPLIEKIMSQVQTGDPIVEYQPILAGYNLVIAGKQLRGDVLLVNVGGIEVTPVIGDINDTQIIIPLPASLHAGVHGVQVVHQKLMGSPPIPHKGLESNIASFVLRPRLDPAPILVGQPTSEVIDSVTYKTGELQLNFNPVVGIKQRVVLLLNEKTTNTPAHAYSIQALPGNGIALPTTETASVIFPFKRVATGDYLVRVQVDGAESLLSLNQVGEYDQPKVTI